MKQYFVAWLCVFALACGHLGCSTDPHTAERAANAGIGISHQVALEKCLSKAAVAVDAGDRAKADADYKVCADAADKEAGRK